MNKSIFEKYVRDCQRTWNKTISHDLQIVNSAMGLAGEIIELNNLLDNNASVGAITDEAGDVMFYLVMYASLLQLYYPSEYLMDIYDNSNRKFLDSQKNIFSTIGNILEYTKKFYFHGHELKKIELFICIQTLFTWILHILEEYNIELENVLNYNTHKLHKRYPDGFNSQDSINRE